MKHNIDLWGQEWPKDFRWDHDPNAEMLNIIFTGGTFGNFLRFFIDKFSKHSPDIEGDPFTDEGTSHATDKNSFSGLFQRYHQHFINDNIGKKDLPVCIITPSTKKHFLYLKKANWFRAGDKGISPDHLWKKAIGEMPDLIKGHALSITKLYDIKDDKHFIWIPKFIVRDWYKMEFLLDIEDTYDHQWFETLKSHEFFEDQKVHHLDLETFFGWQSFFNNIKELDQVFDLALDFDRQHEMRALFNKGLELDVVRKECNLVESVLENGSDESLTDLDVSTEAFIYAEMEKKHTDIQMPLTNRFFRDYEEIKQFLEHFPVWHLESLC
jgi:hypothetical protein